MHKSVLFPMALLFLLSGSLRAQDELTQEGTATPTIGEPEPIPLASKPITGSGSCILAMSKVIANNFSDKMKISIEYSCACKSKSGSFVGSGELRTEKNGSASATPGCDKAYSGSSKTVCTVELDSKDTLYLNPTDAASDGSGSCTWEFQILEK